MHFTDIGSFVSSEYASNIIIQNEIDKVESLLESHFPLDEAALLPGGNFEVAGIMLETTSAMQGKNMLSERIANLMIEHLSSRIYLLDFLQLVLLRCNRLVDINSNRLDQSLLKKIMDENLYDEQCRKDIAELDESQFVTLCHYIIQCFCDDDSKLYDSRIGIPLARYVYDNELIPRECLFMYLRLNLCKYEVSNFNDLMQTMFDFFDDSDDYGGIPQ